MNTTSGLGFAAILALGGATSGPSIAQPAPTAVIVPIKNFAFMPMAIGVATGGSVTWRNMHGEVHTVVSTDGVFRSGGLDQGDSFTFKFTKPGVYRYICSIHPQMTASVVVK